MLKEIIISIMIIVVIVSLDFFTQNYANESIKQTTTMLNDLKEKIKKGEDSINNIDGLVASWENRRKKLAYFIEHDELEKVETSLTGLYSFIETEEYTEATSELDKSNFILKHIEEKYAFNLENIF